jgi:hypothetical protein
MKVNDIRTQQTAYFGNLLDFYFTMLQGREYLYNFSMRSKVPCIACGKTSSPSGFVFKSSVNKCVCKPCYNRQKRFEKVTAVREASNLASETIGKPQPTVINLEGMFLNVYLDLISHLSFLA